MNAPARQRVLIIDDTPAQLKIIIDLLKQDHHVIFAKDGPTGLDLARSKQPDLVLLDVMMPDMDGHEVIRRLKADPQTARIPVIFLTGRSSAEDETLGLTLGAVDYIAKPVVPAVLRARVETHLRLKRKTDLLEELASLDGLTDIPNRRRLDEHLDQEWRRAARHGHPLALVMADLDHFKAYNDTHGHGQGDDCLRRVAQVFKAALKRPGDLAGRYGGEEFLVILPESDRAGATSLAEEIRAGVEALELSAPGSAEGARMTVSLGVAAAQPTPEGDPAALLKAADQALYQAKSGGRNQVREAQ